MSEQPIKIHFQTNPDNGDLVFTTNYPKIYEELMKFCDDANISDWHGELNGFHAQCWVNPDHLTPKDWEAVNKILIENQ